MHCKLTILREVFTEDKNMPAIHLTADNFDSAISSGQLVLVDLGYVVSPLSNDGAY